MRLSCRKETFCLRSVSRKAIIENISRRGSHLKDLDLWDIFSWASYRGAHRDLGKEGVIFKERSKFLCPARLTFCQATELVLISDLSPEILSTEHDTSRVLVVQRIGCYSELLPPKYSLFPEVIAYHYKGLPRDSNYQSTFRRFQLSVSEPNWTCRRTAEVFEKRNIQISGAFNSEQVQNGDIWWDQRGSDFHNLGGGGPSPSIKSSIVFVWLSSSKATHIFRSNSDNCV